MLTWRFSEDGVTHTQHLGGMVKVMVKLRLYFFNAAQISHVAQLMLFKWDR